MSHAEILILPVLAALAAAPLAAQTMPDLSAAQSRMSETLAAARPAAAAPAARGAELACSGVVRDFDCVVDGEARQVPVAKGPAGDRFFPYRAESAGKPVVMLLAPGASYGYDVHYDFAAQDYDAYMQGKVSSLKGVYVENIERMDPRSAPALCTRPRDSGDASLTGRLDLDTLALVDSRSRRSSPLIKAVDAEVVDSRCGATAMPLAGSLNYDVTPTHYWGQDILQLPQSAAAGRAYFEANLHLCQYDGEWSDSQDVPLRCSLKANQ